jgi:hypothetical protein
VKQEKYAIQLFIRDKIKKAPENRCLFSKIEAKNHTPHCVYLKGMFFDLHNSAHRSINISRDGENDKQYVKAKIVGYFEIIRIKMNLNGN